MSIKKSHIEDVMYGRRRSPVIGLFLSALSIVYGFGVSLRHAFYKAGLFRREKLKQRVISVGNITVGGTGKTPVVMHIADVLLTENRRPAIVSRGYGRKDESRIVVVSDGEQVLADAGTGGDEPVLMGSKLRGVPVVVGSDRFDAALLAHELFGNDTVILDDGFQHVRLQRDLDIVLIDGSDPFGNNKLFPRGILREPLKALRRADVILITHADRTADVEGLKNTIAGKTGARIFVSRPVPAGLVNLAAREQKPPAWLRGRSILAFSGIARPDSFIALLGSLGAKVAARIDFPDHYQYSKQDLASILKKAADENAELIVTTEKDAARLKAMNLDSVWALRIELKVDQNDEWEAVLLEGPGSGVRRNEKKHHHRPQGALLKEAENRDQDRQRRAYSSADGS